MAVGHESSFALSYLIGHPGCWYHLWYLRKRPSQDQSKMELTRRSHHSDYYRHPMCFSHLFLDACLPYLHHY